MTLNEYAVNAGTAAGDANCAAAGRLEWTQDDARIAVDAYNKTLADAEVIRRRSGSSRGITTGREMAMTITEEAVETMKRAGIEITAQRLQIAVLTEALEDLLEAIPKQTNDCDWWPDELTKAVKQAKAVIEASL